VKTLIHNCHAGVPGGPWFNSSGLAFVRQQAAVANSSIAAAKAAGLSVFMASDFIQFPIDLINAYTSNLTVPNATTCIGYNKAPVCISLYSSFTQAVVSAMFDELIATFPDVEGFIFRYGENSPCPYFKGNAPFDPNNAIDSLALFVNVLREELCVKRNKTVVIRTWDTSTSMFHANATFYLAVTSQVQPHPNLIFSIKHTMVWATCGVETSYNVYFYSFDEICSWTFGAE
jgi:hypothetical protein